MDQLYSCFLVLITLGAVTVTVRCLKVKGADASHSETKGNHCGENMLVSNKRIALHNWLQNKHFSNYFGCPKDKKNNYTNNSSNNTAGTCRITFRAESDNDLKAYRLCLNYLWIMKCNGDARIIVSYGKQAFETRCRRAPKTNMCSPAAEELHITYESDNLCSADSHPDLMGFMEVTKEELPGMINLIRSRPCPRFINYKDMEFGASIVSKYRKETTDQQYLCSAKIEVAHKADSICFSFQTFRAYLGGASLIIDLGFTEWHFNYDYRPPMFTDKCVTSESLGPITIYVKQDRSQTKDSRFYHEFLFKYRITKVNYRKPDDDFQEHDTDNWLDHRWLLFLITIPLLCCTCCYQIHSRRKRGATILEPSQTHRRDQPESHPAFVNVSRRTTMQPPRQETTTMTTMTTIFGRQGDRRFVSNSFVLEPLSQQTNIEQSIPDDPPVYEGASRSPTAPATLPPSYESLFPEQKEH